MNIDAYKIRLFNFLNKCIQTLTQTFEISLFTEKKNAQRKK
jgi:hypothetical protein